MTTGAPADGSTAPAAAMPVRRRHPPANWRSLWRLILIQAQNAFNDKVAQFTLLGLAKVWLDRAASDRYAHIVSALLVIPLLFFAPLAGWLADRYSKRRVVIACSLSQVVLLAAIAGSFWMDAFWFATSLFFLLAMQAAIFHPARSGIVKEYAGERRLTIASGWAQMAAILAFVAGQWVGGRLFEFGYEDVFERSHPGAAAALPMALMAALSVIPLVLAWQMSPTPAHSRQRFSRRLLTDHFLHLSALLRIRTLRLASLGVAFFWFSATLLTLILIQVATEIEPNEASQSERSGMLLAFVGAGVAIGSVLVALASPNRVELGLVPLGGLGMALGPALTWFVEPGGTGFCLLMLVSGAASAIFLVPLNAYLQDRIEPRERGKMLAAAGLLDSLAMMLSIGVQLAFMRLGVGVHWQLMILGILCLATTVYVLRIIPQSFIRFTALGVVRIFYRIRPLHPDRVPEEGGAMLVCTHVSYLDSLLVSAACDRPVRFVAYDAFFRRRYLGWILRVFGVVPISPTRAKEAVVSVADALQEGALVCLFPEGQLTRTGMRNPVQKGFELMARRADVPVIPMHLDNIWGSLFTFADGKFFRRRPRRAPAHVQVIFGTPLPAREATAQRVAEEFRELAAEALGARVEIRRPLNVAAAEALGRDGWRLAAVDGRGRVSRALLFAQAMQLARRWRNATHARVAVVLPPGVHAVRAMLAVRFAGGVPVYVAPGEPDPLALKRLFEDAGIRSVVSHSALRAADPAFPWPDHFLYLNAELEELDDLYLVADVALALTAPARAVRARARRSAGRIAPGEGAGYISRKPDGRPRLTMLPDSAILAQAAMLRETGLFRQGDTVLSSAPLHSAAGFLGMWHAVLHGVAIAFVPPDRPDAVARRIADFPPDLAAGDVSLADSLRAAASDSPLPRLRAFLAWSEDGGGGAASAGNALHRESGAAFCPGLTRDDAGILLALSQPHPAPGGTTSEPQEGWQPGSPGRPPPAMSVLADDARLRFRVPPGGPETTLDNAQLNPAGFLTRTNPSPNN